MIKFNCRDYGYNCNYKIEGDNIENIIEEFNDHNIKKHKIDYGKEALMHYINRKRNQ